MNGKVYFSKSDSQTGYKDLMVYDVRDVVSDDNTTDNPPKKIHNIKVSNNNDLSILRVMNGKLYFNGKEDGQDVALYFYDPENGVQKVGNKGGVTFNNLTVLNNKLYFSFNDTALETGRELWVYDPEKEFDIEDDPTEVSSNPRMIANIYQGNNSSTPEYLTAMEVNFTSADNGNDGRELWVYDPESTGTYNSDVPTDSSSNPK